MIIVKEIYEAGGACPFQLTGITDKGEEVYVRYRSGTLRVEIAGQTVFCKFIGVDQNDQDYLDMMKQAGISPEHIADMAKSFETMRAYSKVICFDGSLTLEELFEATEGIIQWPQQYRQ